MHGETGTADWETDAHISEGAIDCGSFDAETDGETVAVETDGGTFTVEVDRETSVLYVDLSGRVGADEIDEAATAVLDAAEQLGERFNLITDLSGFQPPSPTAVASIGRTQRTLVRLGLDRVVRVVDETTSTPVENAFERRSREVGYAGESVSSVAAARRRLGARSR